MTPFIDFPLEALSITASSMYADERMVSFPRIYLPPKTPVPSNLFEVTAFTSRDTITSRRELSARDSHPDQLFCQQVRMLPLLHQGPGSDG